MSMRNRRVNVVVIVALVAAAAGCSRPKPVVAPEVGTPAQPPAQAAPAPQVPTTQVTSEPKMTPAQTPEDAIRSGELPADIEAINQAGYLEDVFFDTNVSDLSAAARDALAADAAWLKQHPTIRIRVEGHADERNTEEYNLALGWRRANAVKDYLVSLGVDADRISTISYGEERPFATGSSEAAWAQNRRAHLVVTGR